MKKIKLLTPILSLATLSTVVVPMASASCSNGDNVNVNIEKDSHIQNVLLTEAKLNKPLTAACVFDTGYTIDNVIVRVDNKALVEGEDYAIDGTSIKIYAKAMTSKTMSIIVTSTEGETPGPVPAPEIDFTFPEDINSTTYTYNQDKWSYLFDISSPYHVLGLEIDTTGDIEYTPAGGQTEKKTYIENLITWTYLSTGQIKVDVNMDKLNNATTGFSMTTDGVVKLNLKFENNSTNWSKTVNGLTINIIKRDAPTELKPIPFDSNFFKYNEHGVTCMTDVAGITMLGAYANFPEVFNMVNLNAIDVDFSTLPGFLYQNTLIWFASPYVDPDGMMTEYDDAYWPNTYNEAQSWEIPACINDFKISNFSSHRRVIINCRRSNLWADGGGRDYGFVNVDLGKDAPKQVSDDKEVYLFGDQGFINHNKMNKLTLGNRKTIMSIYKYYVPTTVEPTKTVANQSPFEGCVNLNVIDATVYKTTEDVDNFLEFEQDDTNTVFYRDEGNDKYTHAKQGTIYVANNDVKQAVQDKFATAGITFGDEDWKVEVAE